MAHALERACSFLLVHGWKLTVVKQQLQVIHFAIYKSREKPTGNLHHNREVRLARQTEGI